MSLPSLFRRTLASLLLVAAAFLVGRATGASHRQTAAGIRAALFGQRAAQQAREREARAAASAQTAAALRHLGAHLGSEAGYAELLRRLLAWAETDPKAALAYAQSYLSSVQRDDAISRLLGAWAARNPQEAWSWTKRNLPDDYTHYDAVLAEVGKTDPALAWNFAADLAAQKKPEFAQTIYASALRGLIYTGNYDEAAQLIAGAKLPSGQNEFDLSSMLAGEWGRYDPEAAAAWVMALPDDHTLRRQQALVSLGVSWSQSDPEAAADFAAQLPSGVARQNMLATALGAWATASPDQVGAWLVQYQQQPDFDLVVQAVATSPRAIDQHLDLSIGWADTILNDNVRIQSLEQIMDHWMQRDPAAATGYLQNSSDLSSATLERLRQYFKIPGSK